MLGATLMLYEGTPDYPQPDRLWELVERHHASVLGVSPTAIRALMGKGDDWVTRHDLSSLRVFGSTGEPWNPGPWNWLFNVPGRKALSDHQLLGRHRDRRRHRRMRDDQAAETLRIHRRRARNGGRCRGRRGPVGARRGWANSSFAGRGSA